MNTNIPIFDFSTLKKVENLPFRGKIQFPFATVERLGGMKKTWFIRTNRIAPVKDFYFDPAEALREIVEHHRQVMREEFGQTVG